MSVKSILSRFIGEDQADPDTLDAVSKFSAAAYSAMEELAALPQFIGGADELANVLNGSLVTNKGDSVEISFHPGGSYTPSRELVLNRGHDLEKYVQAMRLQAAGLTNMPTTLPK